jgi:hypothetical protein
LSFRYSLKGTAEDTDQEENTDPRKDYVHLREYLKDKILEQKFITKNQPDIHLPDSPAKGGRK